MLRAPFLTTGFKGFQHDLFTARYVCKAPPRMAMLVIIFIHASNTLYLLVLAVAISIAGVACVTTKIPFPVLLLPDSPVLGL